jgi:hypothetical protein
MITLKYEVSLFSTEITYSFGEASIPEVLDHVACFLRACSYTLDGLVEAGEDDLIFSQSEYDAVIADERQMAVDELLAKSTTPSDSCYTSKEISDAVSRCSSSHSLSLREELLGELWRMKNKKREPCAQIKEENEHR